MWDPDVIIDLTLTLTTPSTWQDKAACNKIRAHGGVVLVSIDALWFPKNRFFPFLSFLAEDAADSVGGLWRSDNAGASWKKLGDPAGLPKDAHHSACLTCLPDLSSCYSVLNFGSTKPELPNIFFHSADKGKSWTAIDSLIKGFTRDPAKDTVRFAKCTNIKLLVKPESVALMVIDTVGPYFETSNNQLPDIYYSSNGVKSPFKRLKDPGYWELKDDKDTEVWFVGLFPGGQFALHGAIAFDTKRPNFLYVSGDRQVFYGEGAGEFGEPEMGRKGGKLLARRSVAASAGSRPPVLAMGHRGPAPFGKSAADGRLFTSECYKTNLEIPSKENASNSLGAFQYSANVYRIKLNTETSESLVGKAYSAMNTAPFPDTRNMHVDPVSGDLILVCDGGIFKRTYPHSRQGKWFSLMGTGIGNTECHSTVYDPVTKRFGCGMQDAGSAITAKGNPDDVVGKKRWFATTGGDGGPLTVGEPVHPQYGPKWIFTFPQFWRQHTYIDPKTNQIPAGTKDCIQGSGTDIYGADFYQRFARNPYNPSSFLLTSFAFGTFIQSDDNMRTFRNVSASIYEAWWVNQKVRKYLGSAGSGVVFGGKLQGQIYKDVWIGWMHNAIVLNDPAVFKGAVRIAHPFLNEALIIGGVAWDPENYRRICITGSYEATFAEEVYCSLDGNFKTGIKPAQLDKPYEVANVTSWTKVTGNYQTLAVKKTGLATFAQTTGGLLWIRTPSVNSRTTYREFLISATAHGIVYMDIGRPGVWKRFPASAGQFPTAIIVDLHYEPSEDMIYGGTMGRGVWSLRGVGQVLISDS